MNSSARRGFQRAQWIVLLVACAVFLGCILSPPALMDDVDAVQANIARTMLTSGDWITARLDGVKYFEKPPLKYWLIAVSFKLFGIHDYVARLPLALIDVLLCWLVFRIGVWAFGERAGFYAGLLLSSSIGLFLFTRILISDSQITCAITLSLWGFLRSLDPDEPRPRLWGFVFWSSAALAIMLKGLIGAVFPLGIAFVYLAVTRQLLSKAVWRRLNPSWGSLGFLAIAAPWHLVATLQNPPYLRFDLHSGPGQYRGFFWDYFFNEHLLRFLNRRYPHDYNTVPRLWFWLLNLVWLFPATVYLGTLWKQPFNTSARAARFRLLALCWIAFVMFFFTLSSTQEYYSMPIYPAVALLLGSGIVEAERTQNKWLARANWILGVICALALAAMLFLLIRVWNLPAPGDISQALHSETTSNYTLSLGHMGDLTIASFAYLRGPLMLAALAVTGGLLALLFVRPRDRILAISVMMVLFFHAARWAMVTFDPYLSSRALAIALRHSPRGSLIVSDQYYSFSSVLFYASRDAYLLNGRIQNLEYGSNAPDAPPVFIDDARLAKMWHEPHRCYLLAEHEFLPGIERTVGAKNITVVKESGGKYLLTNLPLERYD